MIDLLSTLIENCFLLIVSAGLLYNKPFNFKRAYALLPVIVAKIVFLSLPNSYQTEYLSTCINTLIAITIIYIYTKSTLKDSILCYVTTYIVAMVIQLPFAALNYPLTSLFGYNTFIIIGSAYTLTVGILVCRFFNLNKLYLSLFGNGKWGTLCIGNIFAFAVLYALYFKLDKSHFGDVVLFATISFFILLCVNMLLINQIKNIQIQNEQIRAYEQYMPMLEDLINSVRMRQHHHTNELQSIIALMYTHNDYISLTTEMKKYVNIAKKTEESDYLLKLNLPLVAGFLYHKHCEAKQLNKHIHFHIQNYTLISSIPEYQLIEMFGILIDNALEAVSDGEEIYVIIDSKDNKIFFTTRNHGFILSDNDRKLFFTQGYSKKPDATSPHSGLGLYHLKELITNQYDGSIALWNEGEDILFEIIV